MIIECQTCHARFRLDESRIKGRGARVKCRKCGDSIVVLKNSAPASPPPPPGDDGFFDLGSAVRDSAADRPPSAAPPTVGNLIPFPVPVRPEEPVAPEATPPDEPATTEFAASPEKDDVDLSFDRFHSVRPEGDEIPAPPLPGSTRGPELGGLTLDFAPEESLNLPPVEESEPTAGEPQPAEPAAEFRGEGGFLIGDSETLDFRTEERAVSPAEAPPRFDDISLAIVPVPAGEAGAFLREPESPPDEIPLEGNSTPPSTPVMEPPPQREEEPPPVTQAGAPGQRRSPAQESPRARSSAGPAAAAVLAILLAGGGYFGLTTSGRKTLEGAVPGVASLWGGKPAAPAGTKYDLRNVIGYYESGVASPRILVIKGQVANLSTAEKSGIRVHAALLDNTDTVLVQQEVYAGNMLSGEAIRKGDRAAVRKSLGNRFGEGLANMQVAPGKAIPFMLVFFDAPASFDSYKLEAKDVE